MKNILCMEVRPATSWTPGRLATITQVLGFPPIRGRPASSPVIRILSRHLDLHLRPTLPISAPCILKKIRITQICGPRTVTTANLTVYNCNICNQNLIQVQFKSPAEISMETKRRALQVASRHRSKWKRTTRNISDIDSSC